ncbi:MAG TPA: hypothetical protein VIK86_05940 [Candidatus Paceibacterota bacterium]
MSKLDAFIYPVTVEEMGAQLKKLCDGYRSGKINLIQFEADLRTLMYKRNQLFCSAVTQRWIGKKRVDIVNMIVGPIQCMIENI